MTTDLQIGRRVLRVVGWAVAFAEVAGALTVVIGLCGAVILSFRLRSTRRKDVVAPVTAAAVIRNVDRIGIHALHLERRRARRLVNRYLRELRRRLRGHDASRREEICVALAEHIGDAVEKHGARSAADVRSVLRELGSPASIAAAAAGVPFVETAGWSNPRRWRRTLLAGVVMTVLCLGMVIGGWRLQEPGPHGERVAARTITQEVASGRVMDAAVLPDRSAVQVDVCSVPVGDSRCRGMTSAQYAEKSDLDYVETIVVLSDLARLTSGQRALPVISPTGAAGIASAVGLWGGGFGALFGVFLAVAGAVGWLWVRASRAARRSETSDTLIDLT